MDPSPDLSATINHSDEVVKRYEKTLNNIYKNKSNESNRFLNLIFKYIKKNKTLLF